MSFPSLCQDSSRNTISGPIQLIIGEFIVAGHAVEDMKVLILNEDLHVLNRVTHRNNAASDLGVFVNKIMPEMPSLNTPYLGHEDTVRCEMFLV